MSALARPFARLFGRRPPAGVFPTVEWQVGGHCNYDCSYCIQSPQSRVGQAAPDLIASVIAHLAKLPGGRWDIKMSGGEPFAAKRFLTDIIPGLIAETPHRVSVLTNFSAPRSVLERFLSLTRERLGVVSASLHLEHTDLDPFLDKALWFDGLRRELAPTSSFVVNSVLVPGTVRRLLPLAARIEAAGLRWFPQLMKVKTGTYPYDPDERRLIDTALATRLDPADANLAPSYLGRFCHAGAWYFVLDQLGRASSCRTARRDSGPEAPDLGSMADGSFALRRRGAPCPFSICPCTVPANRGIIEGVGASPSAPPPAPLSAKGPHP